MRAPDELRALVEESLSELRLDPTLGALEEPIRYALGGGGKRIRPVLCLAVCEAAGTSAESVVEPATALELVHTFSLVHDDLPALDDDDERRGRPSVHVAFGEAVALLAGDALLAEGLGLAGRCDPPEIGRELARATLGMIGGQYVDVTGAQMQLEELHRLTEVQRAVVEEVRTALETLTGSQENLERVVRDLIPLQEQRRAEIEEAFRSGFVDITALLLAEQALQQSQTRRVGLEREVSAARVRLEQAVGGPSAFNSALTTNQEQPQP